MGKGRLLQDKRAFEGAVTMMHSADSTMAASLVTPNFKPNRLTLSSCPLETGGRAPG